MIAGAIFLVGTVICWQNYDPESEMAWGIWGLILLILGCICMAGVLPE